MYTRAALDTLRSGHDLDRILRSQALYDGQPTWGHYKRDFIPRQPGETSTNYNLRLDAAVYVPHVSAIVDMVASWAFDSPPNPTSPTDRISNLVDDADRRGTNLSTFLSKTFTNACVSGSGWVMVDFPPASDFASYSDQVKRGGLLPHLVQIPSETVRYWETDAYGNITSVMVRDIRTERRGPGYPVERVWRWRHLDADQVVTWEYRVPSGHAEPNHDTEIPRTSVVEHHYGRVPILRFNLTDIKGLYLLGKLYEPAVDLCQRMNDRKWALSRYAHPLFVITRDQERALTGDVPRLGPGRYVEVNIDEKMEWVGVDGSSFMSLRESEKDAKDTLYRVVQQMASAQDSGDSSRAITGAAKEVDWKGMKIMLATYANLFKDFATRVLRLVEALPSRPNENRKPWKGQILGMDSWTLRTSADFLIEAGMAVHALQMSPTFAKSVAKREVRHVLGTHALPAELKQIDDEIDRAEPEYGQFSAQMSQVFMAEEMSERGLDGGGGGTATGGKKDGDGDGIVFEPPDRSGSSKPKLGLA